MDIPESPILRAARIAVMHGERMRWQEALKFVGVVLLLLFFAWMFAETAIDVLSGSDRSSVVDVILSVAAALP